MPSLSFCIILLVLIECLTPPVQAAAATPAQPWLPTATQTRQNILDQLAPKAKQPPYDRVLPLLQKAQAELAKPDSASRASAVSDAYDAALLVMDKTNEYALAARLFDGFLLPNLSSASPDPTRYNGRLHLLKTAASVYGQAGMPDRQLAVLTLLRQEAADNENLEDWVSLQLSALYAQRKQYAPAADALAAVKTPEMMGPVSSFEDLEQKADEQKADEQKADARKTYARKTSLHKQAVKVHHARAVRIQSHPKRLP